METNIIDETTEPVVVPADALRATTAALLERAGMDADDAGTVADALVAADLRGVETHGVSNMLRKYLEWLAAGHVNGRPRPTVVREAASVANVDGDAGLGIAVGPQAMRMAIDKARGSGVGFVTVHNSRHLGMLAYHAMLPLEHNMIGIALTAVGPLMVPTFGREARLGTNPIAVAAPAASRPPFVFDAATTTVAGNRLQTSYRKRIPLPPGAIAAEDGTPIMHSSPASSTADAARLLPLGGSLESGSHKGYGLATVVEILAGVLAGCTVMSQVGRGHASHLFAALDVAAFADVDDFAAAMDELLASLTGTPPAAGHERVLYAGLAEWELQQRRLRDGVPLHPEVGAWFDEACDRWDVPRLRVMEP